MSTTAHVMAMGPYSQEIAPCLEYPPEYYRDCKDGTIVFADLFCTVTRDQAMTLAGYVGAEPFNFNTHLLSPEKIMASIDDLAELWPNDAAYMTVLTTMAGWKFYFRIEA